MDTYENNDIIPEPVPQDTEQPVLPSREPEQTEQPSDEAAATCADETPQEDGFYHSAGTGEREALLVEYGETDAQEPAAEEPQLETEEKPARKKRGPKILRGILAAVVALSLVVAGCFGSAVVMNYHWHRQSQLLQKSYEERIAVLREQIQELENQEHEQVIVPVEGMTPSQIYEMNIQSVVAVNCNVRAVSNGQSIEGKSSGSGFVLTSDGYIVTNHHVVNGATSITVTNSDGKTMTAKLVGSDATNDIAMLKVDGVKMLPVTLGSSDALKVGDQVVAIGNALGELSFSLTAGFVSGMDRDVNTDGSVLNMIQTDASINSGNSGGPLFNSKGELVGITTAKYSGTTSSGATIEGIGFAIPIDDVFSMLEDLRQFGYVTGAYLGVYVTDVPADVANMYGLPLGVYVTEPMAGGSADRAGVQAKDIIINLGGYDIRNMNDLTKALRKFKAGDKATITVWRSGLKLVLELVFDEKPHN